MTKGQRKNVAASVKQRLLNLARERGEEFNLVLVHYGMERLLYRLSRSEHADAFVLKGAMLFHLFSDVAHRPTRDLDLLGSGTPDEGRMKAIFIDVCSLPVEDDGLAFDGTSVRVNRIREDDEYEGIRVQLVGRLDAARISLQVDIGFGDAVTPCPQKQDIPCMLDFPSPRLKIYPWETVVAEKYQAVVQLGMANSRMKDFFDLWHLSQKFEFSGIPVADAIQATFERRATELPESVPVALSSAFTEDAIARSRWAGFLKRSGLADPTLNLRDVAADIWQFLEPVTASLRTKVPFSQTWPEGGPWS